MPPALSFSSRRTSRSFERFAEAFRVVVPGAPISGANKSTARGERVDRVSSEKFAQPDHERYVSPKRFTNGSPLRPWLPSVADILEKIS
jgi:hypothetical protein